MKNILRKEFILASSPLTYVFLVFGFMFFIPNYPILCGAFFITLGIFQGWNYSVMSNDILFSALLPVKKTDVVRGKYIFVSCVELFGFVLMALSTFCRLLFLSDSPAYVNNALMNANFFALGSAAIIFGLFNAIFVGGLFRTCYKITKPFIIYAVSAFVLIALCESLHHFPGLEALNASGFSNLPLQTGLLLCGLLIFAALTFFSCRIACKRFEKTDL